MEKTLFRLHKQNDDRLAKDIKDFIEYYFSLFSQKVKIIIQEFKLEDNIMGVNLAQPEGKMFDIIIETSDENKFNLAHAAGWSYLHGIKRIKFAFQDARTTFHNNKHLAESLKSVEHLFQGL